MFAISMSVLGGTAWAALFQESKPRRVERVKRPAFTEKDWDGIYFKNLFTEGLVGPRPESNSDKNTATPLAPTDSTTDQPATFAWSKVIVGEAIENEVKSLEQTLQRQVTTPVKFKSEYAQARLSYSMLSMLFAIVREYEIEDIRWKKHAPVAQAAFGRAAVNARTGTQQAFQNAKLVREDLTEMVRGGTFRGSDKAPDQLEWPLVVDRSPLMERLQTAVNRLKPATSNQKEFTKNIDLVFHEANIVAAIGYVLIQKDMDEADEDEYAEYAIAMSKAASAMAAAVKDNNFEVASQSANTINQACSDCHGDWR